MSAAGTLLLTVLLATGCDRLGLGPSERGLPPTISLHVTPEGGPVPLEVVLDSSGSFDPDGRIEVRELSVNDGPFEAIEELHSLTIRQSGSHRLTVRIIDAAGHFATEEVTIAAEPGTASTAEFAITVEFPPARVDSRERQVFDQAARRWSELIVGDLPDVTVEANQVESACGAGYRFSGLIDDLLLFGDVRELDGPGGVVGIAGSCLLRHDGTPLVGVIVLDRNDVDGLAASGNLENVVLHELGHVLDLSMNGWQRRGLLEHDRSECLESRSVHFTGASAADEFRALGGRGPVPVEDNGVLGTACSHWDESTFHSELMTGYLDQDSRLSRVTVGALADMGYLVDPSAADEYALPDPNALRPQRDGIVVREWLLKPSGVIGEDGILIPLADPGTLEGSINLRRMAPN